MSIVKDIIAGLGEGAGNAATGGVPAAIQSVSELANGIVNRIWPDPAQEADRRLALEKLQHDDWIAEATVQLQAAQGQMEVNKVEASNVCLFVSGWRPAVGWLCALGLLWQFFLSPLLGYAIAVWVPGTALPVLPTDALMTLLFGMLGLVGARSFEKVKGTARETL